ncbi:nitronate monooxygenase [Metallumcola ferriviriculae]|uniref:Probable nitronate monooxygenase n=1 Tax=Metallumcola ferriviriculae TaxID=3039180 RepID=A0AAU0UQB8_9FIRM|nr:nitronate monooxygenase [Desulfitibacteraceae bacterium MK1]
MKTRITEMLGIKYPLVCGGMMGLGRAELAAAVSNAGGLGTISANIFSEQEELTKEIEKVKQLTNRPFAMTISMLPEMQSGEITKMYVRTAIEQKVPVVETSGASPEPFIGKLQENGIRVFHKVPAGKPAERYALKAEKIGADAVIIAGFECGGHPGENQVSSLVFVPKVKKRVQIPVIAAGGFADASGFTAALALGADAVTMGTRFVFTEECIAHPDTKQRLIEASENDTVLVQKSIRNTTRVLANEAAERALGIEARGGGLQDLMAVINGKRGRAAWLEGKPDLGLLACGTAVGLIDEVKPVQAVIEEIISESQGVMAQLKQIFG